MKSEAMMKQVDAKAVEKRANVERTVQRVALVAALGLYAGLVFAGSDDPMGDGMCWLVKKITGKWVFGASVVGLIATGLTFISGVEMNEFMKKVVGAILVVCFLLTASNMVSRLAAALGSAAVAC